MTYQETIDFLYSRLPVFHQIGARAFKPGLHTTIQFCNAIGNPQEKYPCVHIGGTNGKGSTSHMLAAVLQQAGYKVGLYTSPHLKSFTERIKINGTEIDENFVANFTSDNLFNIDRFEPSFFELTVALAFSYFSEQYVDIAIIEVGMGGRLDSTNIIEPILSLITNVSYDHIQFLGDTLEKIAAEKAGIIKPGVPVVVSEMQEYSVSSVFTQEAGLKSSRVTFASEQLLIEDVTVEDGGLVINVYHKPDNTLRFEHLRMDLTGTYQRKNVPGVISALDELRLLGYHIGDDHIRSGLSAVKQITGLKGRWQQLGRDPLVYCDTAHNFAGLQETLKQFSGIASTNRRFVIGFVADKDISSMLRLFPLDGVYYFCQPTNQRALNSSDLASSAQKAGLAGNVFGNVNDALKAARNESIKSDTIYVGGSTFVVADLDDL